MTELSFLIELLLDHDLPKESKTLIAKRIKDVEANLTQSPAIVISPKYVPNYTPPNPTAVPQSLSTLAAMARQSDPNYMPPPPPIEAPSVETIGQTPAAIQALNSRQQAISGALAGNRNDLYKAKPKPAPK